MDALQLTGQVLAAAMAGGVAGYFAPWLNWEVEKRRIRRAYRERLVQSWREQVLGDWSGTGNDLVIPPQGLELTKTPAYATLRPHLSQALRDQLEPSKDGTPMVVLVQNGNLGLRRRLMTEIEQIEKAWKLV